MTKSGSANASVHVRPFRAFVGSRTAVATDPKKNWRDIRSAIAVGSTTLHQVQQLPATSGNHRWDLIYAKVDVDVNSPSVNRYVKGINGAISLQPIVVHKVTEVSILRTSGSEAASPVRPNIPNDSGSSYYIPLAFVLVRHPWTTASTIDNRDIHEVAPCIPISAALGVPSIAPANHLHKAGGSLLSTDDWDATALRPPAHLPPTMVGGAERLIPFDLISSPKWPPLNAITAGRARW